MVTAIVLAAGTGKRMGSKIPKQFLPLKDKTILEHTLKCFETCREINEIILVIHPQWLQKGKQIANSFQKVTKIVEGGAERQDSVWAGLKEVRSDIVLVHDGVRPFVPQDLILRVIEGTKRWGAVVPALEAKETVKWVEDRRIKKTLPREFIYLAQTPQGFKSQLLKNAYNQIPSGEIFTDDASLIEQLGYEVHIVPGYPFNLKITTTEELEWAKQMV